MEGLERLSLYERWKSNKRKIADVDRLNTEGADKFIIWFRTIIASNRFVCIIAIYLLLMIDISLCSIYLSSLFTLCYFSTIFISLVLLRRYFIKNCCLFNPKDFKTIHIISYHIYASAILHRKVKLINVVAIKRKKTRRRRKSGDLCS